MNRSPILLAFFSGTLIAVACSANGSAPGGSGEGSGAAPADGDGDLDLPLGGSGQDDFDLMDEPGPATCGDGVLDPTEACDDGNEESSDGCAKNCLFVEQGFICSRANEPCLPFAKCGDGQVYFPEQCDDGETEDSDGCSSLCKIEIGSKCEGEPSVCSDTICGDSVVEGAEGCDDGNSLPFDGCDARCQWEPSCGEPGTEEGCSSFCGDGILWGNEVCDDGNTVSGDGCSSDCEEESGYTCSAAPCEMIGDHCVLRVPAIYRDFLDGHPNFACGGGSVTKGLLETSLENGKPIYNGNAGPCVSESNNPTSWYVDGSDHATVASDLVLFAATEGANTFVNRFLADGTPYENADGALIDGTPLFFPLDGFPVCEGEQSVQCVLEDTLHAATIPGEPNTYEPGGWIPETPEVLHNFSFTTEVSYFFRWDEETPPTLDFLGDDDVWVFVNGKLAIDLGGLHVPLSEEITLDTETNEQLGLGLVSGNVYPIKVFHAERNPTGSSFRLTLSGFRAERSSCVSNCGDGIVAAGEECDDGENDGGHNECQPGCVLSTYCGDGKVSEGEECDDNAPDAPATCSGCRIVTVR